MTWRHLVMSGALALCAGIAVGYWAHRPPPSLAQAVAHATTQRDSLTSAHLAPVVVHRDSVVTRWLTTYRTVRDSVHDTVPVHDTAWVIRTVAVCDSLASACAAFRDTARLQHALDTLVQQDLRTELRLAQQRPSVLHQVKILGLTFLAGTATGYAVRHRFLR